MDGLGGKAIRTDFAVEPENMKVNVSYNVLKHVFRKAHDIIRSGKILPAPSAVESKIIRAALQRAQQVFI